MNDSAAVPKADYAVLQQAAEWFAVLHSGRASDEDRLRCRDWIDHADAHRAAWRRVESVARQVGGLGDHVADRAQVVRTLDTASALRLSRRRTLGLLTALLSTTAVAWSGAHVARSTTLMAWRADRRTAVGEIGEYWLDDGSQLWLDTASAADIDYSDQWRRIVLHHGTILVETATDHLHPSRALVVDTAHGRIRAIGTRFSVRFDDAGTDVAVLQGAVELTPATAAQPPLIVPAGSRGRLTTETATAQGDVPAGHGSWARGLLIVDQMPLADVVAELSRYRRGYLGCAPDIAHLRVVGAYPLRDTDHALSLLEATLPIRKRQRLSWWLTLEPLDGT